MVLKICSKSRLLQQRITSIYDLPGHEGMVPTWVQSERHEELSDGVKPRFAIAPTMCSSI
jgi:hypothetical protein